MSEGFLPICWGRSRHLPLPRAPEADIRGDIGDLENQTASYNLAISRWKSARGSGARKAATEGGLTDRAAETTRRGDERRPPRFHRQLLLSAAGGLELGCTNHQLEIFWGTRKSQRTTALQQFTSKGKKRERENCHTTQGTGTH